MQQVNINFAICVCDPQTQMRYGNAPGCGVPLKKNTNNVSKNTVFGFFWSTGTYIAHGMRMTVSFLGIPSLLFLEEDWFSSCVGHILPKTLLSGTNPMAL
jgi:hypothetical protein